jgi:hypothetical protein
LFVGGLEFGAARWEAAIPDHGGAVWTEVGEHFSEGLEKSVDGVRGFTSGIFETADREEGAVEVIVAVYE